MSKQVKRSLRLLFLIVLPQLLHCSLRTHTTLLIAVVAGLIWVITNITSYARHRRAAGHITTAPAQPKSVVSAKPQEQHAQTIRSPQVEQSAAPRKTASIDSDADLSPNEYLNRIDAKTWYFNRNELVLAQIIDNLNVRGHRSLTISADGQVSIVEGDAVQVIQQFDDFPHHMNWPELKQLLSEDDITTSITTNGMELSWSGGD